MKILITGSEGYIGQHLVKKLSIVDTLDIVGEPSLVAKQNTYSTTENL
jgi:nucleoside-diphosphate-sugar epimerase